MAAPLAPGGEDPEGGAREQARALVRLVREGGGGRRRERRGGEGGDGVRSQCQGSAVGDAALLVCWGMMATKEDCEAKATKEDSEAKGTEQVRDDVADATLPDEPEQAPPQSAAPTFGGQPQAQSVTHEEAQAAFMAAQAASTAAYLETAPPEELVRYRRQVERLEYDRAHRTKVANPWAGDWIVTETVAEDLRRLREQAEAGSEDERWERTGRNRLEKVKMRKERNFSGRGYRVGDGAVCEDCGERHGSLLAPEEEPEGSSSSLSRSSSRSYSGSSHVSGDLSREDGEADSEDDDDENDGGSNSDNDGSYQTAEGDGSSPHGRSRSDDGEFQNRSPDIMERFANLCGRADGYIGPEQTRPLFEQAKHDFKGKGEATDEHGDHGGDCYCFHPEDEMTNQAWDFNSTANQPAPQLLTASEIEAKATECKEVAQSLAQSLADLESRWSVRHWIGTGYIETLLDEIEVLPFEVYELVQDMESYQPQFNPARMQRDREAEFMKRHTHHAGRVECMGCHGNLVCSHLGNKSPVQRKPAEDYRKQDTSTPLSTDVPATEDAEYSSLASSEASSDGENNEAKKCRSGHLRQTSRDVIEENRSYARNTVKYLNILASEWEKGGRTDNYDAHRLADLGLHLHLNLSKLNDSIQLFQSRRHRARAMKGREENHVHRSRDSLKSHDSCCCHPNEGQSN
jgi:hypothetical protein